MDARIVGVMLFVVMLAGCTGTEEPRDESGLAYDKDPQMDAVPEGQVDRSARPDGRSEPEDAGSADEPSSTNQTSESDAEQTSSPSSGQGTTSAQPPECPDAWDTSGQMDASNPLVSINTDHGCILVELRADAAPITVENFLKYVDDGFFDNTLFHRIIEDFMAQGGGMDADSGQMKDSTYPPIENEARASGLRNMPYTLAMARTNSPDSATNQFFINTADNSFLDPGPNADDPRQAGYAVFGHVLDGKAAVDSLESVPTTMYQSGAKCQPDRSPSCPTEDQVIHAIRRVTA